MFLSFLVSQSTLDSENLDLAYFKQNKLNLLLDTLMWMVIFLKDL